VIFFLQPGHDGGALRVEPSKARLQKDPNQQKATREASRKAEDQNPRIRVPQQADPKAYSGKVYRD
jgi:hypothetical protein